MVERNQSVAFHAGTRHIIQVPIVDAAGADYPLTSGEIVKFNLARIANGVPLKANPLIDFRSDVSGQVVIQANPNEHIVDVTLLPADTAALLPGDYWFQLEVYTNLNANPVMVSEGIVTLYTNVDNA